MPIKGTFKAIDRPFAKFKPTIRLPRRPEPYVTAIASISAPCSLS